MGRATTAMAEWRGGTYNPTFALSLPTNHPGQRGVPLGPALPPPRARRTAARGGDAGRGGEDARQRRGRPRQPGAQLGAALPRAGEPPRGAGLARRRAPRPLRRAPPHRPLQPGHALRLPRLPLVPRRPPTAVERGPGTDGTRGEWRSGGVADGRVRRALPRAPLRSIAPSTPAWHSSISGSTFFPTAPPALGAHRTSHPTPLTDPPAQASGADGSAGDKQILDHVGRIKKKLQQQAQPTTHPVPVASAGGGQAGGQYQAAPQASGR